MIREIMDYYLTPASPEARQSGYLYEAIAFQARAERNRSAWAPHWEVCQKLVSEFLAAHSEADTLVILGSGCLFEIPCEELNGRIRRLILVDRIFPRSVRRWVKKQKFEIQMIEKDLSNPVLSLKDLAFEKSVVVSSNLLSQLSLGQMNRQKKIETHHLEQLSMWKGRALLWTDVERHSFAKGTRDLLLKEITVATPLSNVVESWEWNLAPAPEFDRKTDVILKMQACHL